MENMSHYSKGLEGVIADESKICMIDGNKGCLFYRGHSVDELQCFEESAYLLIYGHMPDETELLIFKEKLSEFSILPGHIRSIIKSLPPSIHPMEALQSLISCLGQVSSKEIKIHRNDDRLGNKISTVNNISLIQEDWVRLLSALPSLVAAFERHRNGFEILQPLPNQSLLFNFLYMFHGHEPEDQDVSVLEISQILQMEHGFNPSTMTARFVSSTLSPPHSTLSAAIGALYGNIHGGADEAAFTMARDEIKHPSNAKEFVENSLKTGRKIMGMGHRVYRTIDPRARILKKLAKDLCQRTKGEKMQIFKILETVEEAMGDAMEQKGKRIYANVEFYKGPIFNSLNIPSDTFTCLFSMARVFGWAAHCLELWTDHRIYRPIALYTGPIPNYNKNCQV